MHQPFGNGDDILPRSEGPQSTAAVPQPGTQQSWDTLMTLEISI